MNMLPEKDSNHQMAGQELGRVGLGQSQGRVGWDKTWNV